MKYTVSKEADKKVESDLKIIVKELRDKISGVISIVLTGGFSRGEGPVQKIGEKFYPYNDYDIQVICENHVDKKIIDKLSNYLSEKIGGRGIKNFYPFKKEEQKLIKNFYVDLKCNTLKEIKEFFPRIRNYELRNCSKILYGEDVRKKIPCYKLIEIPLSEGAKLLLDRMSQMVEYYSIEKKHDEKFLRYIIQQVYAACCTSLLLLSGKYQIGYKKSMEIFKKNYKQDFYELYLLVPTLDKKIEQYINWKINPNKKIIENVEEEWFKAKKNILEVSKFFFSKFLKKEIKTEKELSKSILFMWEDFYSPYLKKIIQRKMGVDLGKSLRLFKIPVSLIMKYKYYKRLSKFNSKKLGLFFQKSPDLVIFSSVVMILNSINRENIISKKKLDHAKRILSKVYPVKTKDWENISLEYANAYIAFFLQKI